jgi:glutathione S-transferase
MSGLGLFAHPFSSYCQKVLIALYENAVPFTYRHLGDDREAQAELGRLWPLGKFPLLKDGDAAIIEATVIIAYLQVKHPGPIRLIPDTIDAALETRLLDRICDNYVMSPMQKVVGDAMRPADGKDPAGVADALATLEKAYGWINARLAGRQWATGEDFTLADCAAAPSLFYADWVHPISGNYGALRAYRTRLLARPSFARAVDEARPYRGFFPPGAPDRD